MRAGVRVRVGVHWDGGAGGLLRVARDAVRQAGPDADLAERAGGPVPAAGAVRGRGPVADDLATPEPAAAGMACPAGPLVVHCPPWGFSQGGPLEPPFFFVKDSPQGPPTANRHRLPTANRQPPLTSNRQPPPATNHQPPTANRHQAPTPNPQPPTAKPLFTTVSVVWCLAQSRP